jgi:hypothetical protein
MGKAGRRVSAPAADNSHVAPCQSGPPTAGLVGSAAGNGHTKSGRACMVALSRQFVVGLCASVPVLRVTAPRRPGRRHGPTKT